MKIKMIFLIIVLLLLILTVTVLIILPPSKGEITPFVDSQGKELLGSIAEKAYLDVDGAALGIVIRSANQNNPVLLFLGGGPGIPQYWLSYQYPTDLEKYFTVCYLSYRGTGLSYSINIDKSTLNKEQYIKDAVAVTQYLQKRFSEDQIYLMGHSFGTMISVYVANLHPEYYKAYIGISQISNSARSEQIAFNYMLAYYEKQDKTSMVRRLKKYSEYFSRDYSLIESQDTEFLNYRKSLRDTAMHASGVGTTADMKSVIGGIFFPSLRMTDFTLQERINIWRGKIMVDKSDIGIDAFCNTNIADEVPSFHIPMYFFGGVQDYTCCYELQKEFYEEIGAPQKAFYTFNDSAHSPLYEEPERAMKILVNDVLTGTITMAD